MSNELIIQCLNPNQRIEIYYKSPRAVSITNKEGSSVIDYVEISCDEAKKLRNFLNEFIGDENDK